MLTPAHRDESISICTRECTDVEHTRYRFPVVSTSFASREDIADPGLVARYLLAVNLIDEMHQELEFISRLIIYCMTT